MKNINKIINGKVYADNLLKEIFPLISKYTEKFLRNPCLAVILVGEDTASKIYVKNKLLTAEKNNIKSIQIKLPKETTMEHLLNEISILNKNKNVDGILVQLPLPVHISEKIVIQSIDPLKDVDGFHPTNFGRLFMGDSNFVPCTPLGCFYMLKKELKKLDGKHAVIIGRSNIVGKPMASLLLSSNCTVTITHSKTKNLKEHCRNADILISAIGRAELVDNTYVKPNATVIDVGINRLELNDINANEKKYKVVGDVKFEQVINVVHKITPVPGGVGPMTIACLMHNTVKAAYMNKNENFVNIIEGSL
ncbi:bifunctional methylenetetrahydrofolate dehydrogenase/methenyltetrahydrofolate cyclohydrolase [Alphaproteobacteria bacterium]|nr:bifunctional methylenetetrahydrofolate dehydrogenase/methenyltetrahydrofolate cyclohydrolase [Alphaproteobacteria bacterium]